MQEQKPYTQPVNMPVGQPIGGQPQYANAGGQPYPQLAGQAPAPAVVFVQQSAAARVVAPEPTCCCCMKIESANTCMIVLTVLGILSNIGSMARASDVFQLGDDWTLYGALNIIVLVITSLIQMKFTHGCYQWTQNKARDAAARKALIDNWNWEYAAFTVSGVGIVLANVIANATIGKSAGDDTVNALNRISKAQNTSSSQINWNSNTSSSNSNSINFNSNGNSGFGNSSFNDKQNNALAGSAVRTFFLALFMTLIIAVSIGTIINLSLTYFWKESYKHWDAWVTQNEQNPPAAAAGIQMVPGQQMVQQQQVVMQPGQPQVVYQQQ